ncbi:NADPH-dependent F420 reductase [Streptomyces sp. NPDC059072]|uniref:NADPH-dependent F420 reductase n=1 Tax=Streptomyces sp. NPDC059072 TaxID=3346715 RepID=UPI0036A9F293
MGMRAADATGPARPCPYPSTTPTRFTHRGLRETGRTLRAGPAGRNSHGRGSIEVGMATLGLIGSGNIGGTLARLAVDAGLDVVLSNSRGPESLSDLVTELGPRARAATAAEAAAAGDWVVVTIPLGRYRDLPAAGLAGKVVLDTMNYYPERDGVLPALEAEETTTSELVQEHLTGAHVVKVFNNIFFKHLSGLARPAGAADRSALLLAGDDAAAKQSAAALVDLLGFDPVDAGTLADSWRFQRDTPAYALPYMTITDGPGIDPSDPGTVADADALRAALAKAVRPAGS